MTASLNRIWALVLRYAMLLKGSPPRLFETIYWPTLNILFLGFLNLYLMKRLGSQAVNFNMILGGTILLEFFLRPTMALLLGFVEEVYSRNIAQLYVSPLHAHEQLLAYGFIMLLRLIIGLVPALFICDWLFGYNILELGWWLLPFTLNLVLAGSVCGVLVISLLLRFGQSAEWFGWMLSWLFIPFLGVYYPLDILPGFMRVIGQALPPSYVFEGLRQIAQHEAVSWSGIAASFGLNALYLGAALCVFYATLRGARKRGALLSLSE
ncbi:MAG TPA: ABC transporter permease [Alphaproteobacteria bacterium]|nr:ABC transporter permease [Alphaproteobacteria bacterium]